MQFMQMACAFPIALIFGVVALCLFIKPTLTKGSNDYFALVSGHRSDPYQKNNRGGIKIEWLIAVLGIVTFLLALAPVQTLIGVAKTLSAPEIELGYEQGATDLITRGILGFVSLISFLTLGFVKILEDK